MEVKGRECTVLSAREELDGSLLRVRGSDVVAADPARHFAESAGRTYQGLTDQVVMSRTPGSFRTVLVPRGSSKPEWSSA
jgi:hypothetical protein